MAKIGTFIVLMSGLMLLFYFAGLLDDTLTSNLLDLLMNPQDFETSLLNNQLAILLGGIATAGVVVIGLLTRNIEIVLMSALCVWLLNFMNDFLHVVKVVYSVNPVVAILLFSPILFLFSLTMVDWWRARD